MPKLELPTRTGLREVVGASVDSERVHHGEVEVPVVAQVEVKASEPSRR